MSALEGVSALWFAIGMAACALLGALPVAGAPRVSRWMRGVRAAGPSMLAMAALGALTAFGTFGAALARHDFTLRYVAEWTSVLLPGRVALAALTASDVGVRLVWSAAIAVVALCVAVGVVVQRHHARRDDGTATLVGLVGAVLMAAVMSLVVGTSPFVQLATPPLDGRGLPPVLRSMHGVAQAALHLLGLACALVPLAHVAAAVIDGRSVTRWRAPATRALVIAWCVQTLALMLGLFWAQQQTGWFGWWFAWTPWSSAPLLPWLATTFALGAIVSQSPESHAQEMLTAGAIAFASCLAGFAAWQLRVGTALSVIAIPADAMLPGRTRLVAGAVGVLGGAMLVAMAWRRTRGRARMRAAAAAATCGALCIAVGFTASFWRTTTIVPLEMGTPHTLRDPFGSAWTATSQGMSSYREPTHAVLAAALALTHNGTRTGLLTSEQRQYVSIDGEPTFDPITSVGVRHTARMTIAATFDRPMSRDVAAVRISFVPLAWMPFAGALLMLLAIPRVAWPTRADSSDSSPHAMTDHVNDPAEAAIARARARQRSCPVHGPRPELDARFCSECGGALDGVCANCGTPAADGSARYCAECGAAFAR